LLLEEIEAMGVRVIDTSLVSEESHPWIDPERLASVLMSLV